MKAGPDTISTYGYVASGHIRALNGSIDTVKADGGGAVGEAPFNFRAVDCVPAHNSSTAIGSFPTSVTIRRYGPVYWSGTGSPVTIYARTTGTLPYTDYTNDFTVTAVTGNNHRVSRSQEGRRNRLGNELRLQDRADHGSCELRRPSVLGRFHEAGGVPIRVQVFDYAVRA
ncbi:MAG: hypothetical protein AB7G11_17545 [Phycisphaerales bacterium]